MSVAFQNRKSQIIIALLVLILLVLQYRLWIGEGSWEHIVSLEKEIDAQQQTIARLKSRNQVLESEVISLKGGLESVEQRARSELGLIKEGETLFILAEKNRSAND